KSKQRITLESSAQSLPALPNAPVLRPTRTCALFGPRPSPRRSGPFHCANGHVALARAAYSEEPRKFLGSFVKRHRLESSERRALLMLPEENADRFRGCNRPHERIVEMIKR